MGYKFQNQCYETLFDMHVAWSDFCHSSVSGSYLLTCTADTGGYVVMTAYDVVNGTPQTAWNYNPSQIACTYTPSANDFTTQDIIDMSWLTVYCLAVAFAFVAWRRSI